MRIIVNRSMDDGVFGILIENSHFRRVWIDDIPHNNITSESEALARADALRGATGWPIVKEYEA